MTPRIFLPASLFAAALCQAVAAQEAVEGAERTYLEACAGCHGPEAHGDGPTAALLTVDVPDLTLIAARNDGDFDAARIVQLIDGRDGLAAHGGPMPMFGGLLTGPSVVLDAKDGSPVSTSAPILELVHWLETLQREATEEGAQ